MTQKKERLQLEKQINLVIETEANINNLENELAHETRQKE